MAASATSVASEREVSHPVIDLQHEQRTGKHQQVHERAEQPDGGEQTAALAKCSPHLGAAIS